MNNMLLDKRQIERQFERAAFSYNNSAQLQQRIISELLGQVASVIPEPQTIADLGCGTGLGLVKLQQQFPGASLIGVDLAQAMLKQANAACPDAELLKADIESLPLDTESLDLVFSTSTIQWCELARVFSECTRVLKPGGHVALATFGPGTHREWKAAWARIDSLAHTIKFADQKEITQRSEALGLSTVKQWSKTEVLEFGDTRDVLQSVKNLGATNANAERQRGLMGKERFGQFLSAFEQASPAPKLTYEIIYLISQKPGLATSIEGKNNP